MIWISKWRFVVGATLSHGKLWALLLTFFFLIRQIGIDHSGVVRLGYPLPLSVQSWDFLQRVEKQVNQNRRKT